MISLSFFRIVYLDLVLASLVSLALCISLPLHSRCVFLSVCLSARPSVLRQCSLHSIFLISFSRFDPSYTAFFSLNPSLFPLHFCTHMMPSQLQLSASPSVYLSALSISLHFLLLTINMQSTHYVPSECTVLLSELHHTFQPTELMCLSPRLDRHTDRACGTGRGRMRG